LHAGRAWSRSGVDVCKLGAVVWICVGVGLRSVSVDLEWIWWAFCGVDLGGSGARFSLRDLHLRLDLGEVSNGSKWASYRPAR
jgi:hypothetical protein